ncbi:ribonuclease H-like domain-containing protein [Mycena alexandri]|uniref:Ribonuclease H-like domain-containing protein n=1 Tax=Mycena alexandri TaxID=1745969 RepID=A0AAD6WR91_9AGAR|nr:ribonuclease H-like domain-containing protein [Mycena alexandri]
MIRTDGWKDDSRNPVIGTNVATSTKVIWYFSYLPLDLVQANGHKKDGDSMCAAFEVMIVKVEATYRCYVVLFVCDNDGGSQRGRKNLGVKRPWLFIVPCCAHQGQLILGDYLTVNVEASEIAEKAIELIHWILSHDRVRKIFDDAQFVKNFVVLVYLLANLTRWTTHYIAFRRLLHLRIALRYAVYIHRPEILAAQLGVEKNKKAILKITAQVNTQCDLIEDNTFWTSLERVVDDMEPICYATNINQADRTRPDQVLLTFAGLFFHFGRHPNRSVSKGMLARIEKRWAALDQPLFVLCLILNPYEGLGRFGDKSEINVFVLSLELVSLYHRVRSRPTASPRSAAHIAGDRAREHELSTSFMQYMAGTGPFQAWRANKEQFQTQHPDEPHLVWENFKATDGVKELARFAILLLGLVVNQASTERTFSDCKIKKTRLRNRLGTVKLGKMSKVTLILSSDIRQENLTAGLIHERAARNVHDPAKVSGLLSVPMYADALDPDEDEEGKPRSNLVRTAGGWRAEEQEEELLANVTDEEESGVDSGPEPKAQKPPRKPKSFFSALPRTFTREALLMQLLAAEESDESPDDGALSGSGDEFEP